RLERPLRHGACDRDRAPRPGDPVAGAGAFEQEAGIADVLREPELKGVAVRFAVHGAGRRLRRGVPVPPLERPRPGDLLVPRAGLLEDEVEGALEDEPLVRIERGEGEGVVGGAAAVARGESEQRGEEQDEEEAHRRGGYVAVSYGPRNVARGFKPPVRHAP